MNAKWHIAIWHFLQDVISLLNTQREAVKPPSQSFLIDYMWVLLRYNLNFKGSLTAWFFGLFENSNKSFVRIVTYFKMEMRTTLKNL